MSMRPWLVGLALWWGIGGIGGNGSSGSTLNAAEPPAIAVRLQSFDDWTKVALYFSQLANQEEAVKQGLGIVEALKGPKGLEGIDTTRPLGLFAYLGADVQGTRAYLCIPVVDEDAVLGLMARFLPNKPQKNANGVYNVNIEGVPLPVYFRFVQKHLVATVIEEKNLDAKQLPDLAKLLPAQGPLLSASLRLDQLSEETKKLALGQVELALTPFKAMPAETELEKKLKAKAIDNLMAQWKSVLFNGVELRLEFDIVPAKDDIRLSLAFSAKPGTALATDIAAMGTKKSVLAGTLKSPTAAAVAGVNVLLPDMVQGMIKPLLDEAMKQLNDQPLDPRLKEIAGTLHKVLRPTLEAGDIDGGLALLGPSTEGHFTVLAGVKVQKGRGIEAAVKEIAKDHLPPEAAPWVQLDADKTPTGNLHKIDFDAFLDDAAARAFLGKGVVWIGFRDDLAVIAVGQDAKSAVKAAMAQAPAVAEMIKLEVQVAKIAPFAKNELPDVGKKLGEKIFGKAAAGKDLVSISVTGGQAIQMQMSIKGKVFQFLAELDKAQKTD